MHEIQRIKIDLMHEIQRIDFKNIDCEHFKNLFMRTLTYHAPQKRRLVRANNSPFMKKELYKAIMTRSRLKNKFLRLKSIDSRNAYKKQRNLCVSLLRRTKKSYYENLDPDLLSDNKKFKETCETILF